jgi:MFS family permease
MSEQSPNRALIAISIAVLLASSTWFTGTAVVPSLMAAWDLSQAQSAWLTISTQLGFIFGTFLYSLLNLADVFNARRVFFASAVLGAGFNACFAILSTGLEIGLTMRFLTGVTLAGVYPVGMKIIASWFREGLGWRLGVMVGALTMGTAMPYLLRALGASLPWRTPVLIASGLATVGGLIVLFFLQDGPHLRSRAKFDVSMLVKVFADRRFRLTAFGYFGHMWELYAFWSLVGAFLAASFASGGGPLDQVPLLAFITIAVGSLGCVGGGWISRKVGERKVATASLVVSGVLCALSWLAFSLPTPLVIVYVIAWGVFVVSDSPQFSALAARYCPPEYTGTALTVQNGVGFAVTIGSIQLVPLIAGEAGWKWSLVVLTLGPVFGGLSMMRLAALERDDEAG